MKFSNDDLIQMFVAYEKEKDLAIYQDTLDAFNAGYLESPPEQNDFIRPDRDIKVLSAIGIRCVKALLEELKNLQTSESKSPLDKQ